MNYLKHTEMIRITSFAILLVLTLSCTKLGKGKKILGEWKCSSWTTENSNADRCNDNVYFNFMEDRSYFSKIGNMADSGSYKIVDGNLYLAPIDKLEFAVKITELDSTNMELLMNRAGLEERLLLEKI